MTPSLTLPELNPAGLRLVDSHAHIQTAAFAHDGDQVLAAAVEAGVERILVPGFDLPSTRQGLEFGRRHGLKTTAGIHPHIASTVDEALWSEVRELAALEAVVGIGETGLDYDRGFSPRDDQLANLARHVALAYETGLPLTLHCRSKPGRRDAQDDLLDVLREGGVGSAAWRARFGPRPPGVLHSFSGPVDYAEAALELDLFIAFGGLVFRPGEEASADVARLTPLDRILTETDSPYLKPRKVKGSRNEPRNVAVTANWLFDLRDDDRDVFGQALVDNFDRFVGA
ncbi:MAG: TatD family hydrolase [Candidatus Limnocylindrales bacterium]